MENHLSTAARHQDPIGNLYAEHNGWLQGWLRKKLGCSHRAADFAHDTFLRLMLRDDVGALREPRAFLTTVARNLVADHWRRQELERAYLEALAILPEPEHPSPEERLLVVEKLLRIDSCLSRLPAITRRVFLQSQFEGFTYTHIAAEMGISLPTVKRHMSRAFLACLSVE